MAGGWRRGWAVRASGRRILDAGWTRGSGSAAQGPSSGRACRAGGARTQPEWGAVRVGTRKQPVLETAQRGPTGGAGAAGLGGSRTYSRRSSCSSRSSRGSDGYRSGGTRSAAQGRRARAAGDRRRRDVARQGRRGRRRVRRTARHGRSDVEHDLARQCGGGKAPGREPAGCSPRPGHRRGPPPRVSRRGLAGRARPPSLPGSGTAGFGQGDVDADRDHELGEVRDERRPAALRSHRRGSGSVQRLPEPGRPDDRRQPSGPGAPPPAHLPRSPQQPQHRTPTSLGDREYSSHRSGRCSREDAGSRRRDRPLAGGQAGPVRRRSGRRPCSRSSWPAPRSCCPSVT